MRTYRVFIASTHSDFKELREAITGMLSITDMFEPVSVFDGGATPDPPIETCLAEVESSDLLILLVGCYSGSLPEGEARGTADPNGLSFTHREFNTAIASDIPVLVYLIGDEEGTHGPI